MAWRYYSYEIGLTFSLKEKYAWYSKENHWLLTRALLKIAEFSFFYLLVQSLSWTNTHTPSYIMTTFARSRLEKGYASRSHLNTPSLRIN